MNPVFSPGPSFYIGIEAVPAQVQSVVVALPARTPARPSGLFPGNPGGGVWWVAEVW